MKKLSFLIVLASLGLPMFAQADVLQDGYHPVQDCVKLENVSEFPEYNFYLSGTGRLGFAFAEKMTTEPGCYELYNWNIVAVEKNNESRLKREPADSEEGGSWPGLSQNQPYIASSARFTALEGQLPESNPIVGRTYMIRVDRVNGSKIDAHVATTEQRWKDGTKKTVSGTGSAMVFPWWGYALVGAGVLGLIGALLKWKK
ncbi:hypothetical protein KBB27_00690 [Patescibacteria group bacterium]|nr:hypothetical protein [Patescibacteria group bacterium]